MRPFLQLFFIPILLIGMIGSARSQSINLPAYPMKFQFKNSAGSNRDTMLSRLNFGFWSKSVSYPSYVKWKNQPFAVLKSSISGVGLFTDSTTSFSTGDEIGYAFFKIGSNGTFDLDYLQSAIGSFVNNAGSPNMEIVATAKGIMMKAKQSIGPNTELTARYQDIINLFPNDKSVERSIKYW